MLITDSTGKSFEFKRSGDVYLVYKNDIQITSYLVETVKNRLSSGAWVLLETPLDKFKKRLMK